MGAQWTSLSGAMSGWVELCEVTVKELPAAAFRVKILIYLGHNNLYFIFVTHLVNSNNGSTRGW